MDPATEVKKENEEERRGDMAGLFRFALTEIGPHRQSIAFFSFLAVLAAALDTLGPIMLGRGFDAAATGGAALGALGVAGWFLFRHAADRLRQTIWHNGDMLSERISESFLARALLNLLNKPLAFHYGNKRSEITEKLSRFRWDFGNILTGVIFEFVPQILAVIATVIYLCSKDWQIGFVLTGFIAAYLTFTYHSGTERVIAHRAWIKAHSKLFGFGEDALENALVVKSTGNEPMVTGKLDELMKVYLDKCLFGSLALKKMFFGQDLISGAGSAACLLMGVLNFASGKFSFGELTTATALIFSVFGYLRYVQWIHRAAMEASANFTLVKETMDEPGEDLAAGEAVDLGADIVLRDVRFGYRPEHMILDGVSFTIPAGKKTAIVGESGEGKTTLVHLLGRYFAPSAGEILVGGRDLGGVSIRSLRDQMAYVPQDMTLFHETVDFNIRCGRLGATDEDVRLAAKRAKLNDFIESLPEKYATVVGERGLKLSGGERQRVALARAFLRDPKLLILDEPTSNLDSKTETLVQGSIRELMAGRTVLVIAHRLKTVADADQIIVLKEGKVVETGTHDELVRRGGCYAGLLKMQGQCPTSVWSEAEKQ